MTLTRPYRLSRLIVALIVLVVACLTTQAQTRNFNTQRLVLDNNAGRNVTLQTGATQTSYSLILPDTVGLTGSLIYAARLGASDSLKWLPPGIDGYVLTLSAGVPTWATSSNWLTTGNAGLSTPANFLGTTDAVDLVLRANNLARVTVGSSNTGGVRITRPPTVGVNGPYNTLTTSMQLPAAYTLSANTSLVYNELQVNSGVSGAGSAGDLYLSHNRLWLNGADAVAFADVFGQFNFISTSTSTTGSVTSFTGFASAVRPSNRSGMPTTFYAFRTHNLGGSVPSIGTMYGLFVAPYSSTNFYGVRVGNINTNQTAIGSATNWYGIAVDSIPIGTPGNKYAFFYGPTLTNLQFGVNHLGRVGVGDNTFASKLSVLETGAFTSAFTTESVVNTATSSTASISKIGTDISSTGLWSGVGATNIGLRVVVSGGTTNYAGLFNGGAVGVGTTTPTQLLEVNDGSLQISTTSATPGTLRFEEAQANGSNVVSFAAPSNLAIDNAYTLPTGFPLTNSQLLASSTAGVLSWNDGSGLFWALGGNSVASPTNLGTITVQPLPIVTSNVERMRILSTGEVGVGTSIPTTNARLHSVGSATTISSTAYGLISEVQAVANSTGIGAYVRTTGATGSLHPFVASSQNNAAVYLGSAVADIPASLATLLTGTTNLNSTYMFNARVSGGLTMVGTTSGTVTLQAPAVIATSHTYTMPAATGTANQVLRVASAPAPTAAAATLEWATAATAPVFARRTSNQNYALNVLANDAQLVVALSANDVFEFEAMIAYEGLTTAAAMQLAFTVPAGATIRWGIVNSGFASISPMSIAVSGTAITDIPVNTTTATNDQVVYVKGLVVMGATPGNLQLQSAATVAATQITIMMNSFLKATKVN